MQPRHRAVCFRQGSPKGAGVDLVPELVARYGSSQLKAAMAANPGIRS